MFALALNNFVKLRKLGRYVVTLYVDTLTKSTMMRLNSIAPATIEFLELPCTNLTALLNSMIYSINTKHDQKLNIFFYIN